MPKLMHTFINGKKEGELFLTEVEEKNGFHLLTDRDGNYYIANSNYECNIALKINKDKVEKLEYYLDNVALTLSGTNISNDLYKLENEQILFQDGIKDSYDVDIDTGVSYLEMKVRTDAMGLPEVLIKEMYIHNEPIVLFTLSDYISMTEKRRFFIPCKIDTISIGKFETNLDPSAKADLERISEQVENRNRYKKEEKINSFIAKAYDLTFEQLDSLIEELAKIRDSLK